MAVPIVDVLPAALTGHEANCLADMAGMRDDLEAAAEMAHRAYTDNQGLRNQIALEALQDAALVRYGRVFGKPGRRDAFRIPEGWLDELTDEQRRAHANFRALRDKHVAHSVNDWEINTPVAYLSIDRETGAGEVRSVGVLQERVILMSAPSLQLLEQLANTLAKRITEEMKSQETRVLEVAKKIPIDELKRQLVEDPPDSAGTGPLDRPRRR